MRLPPSPASFTSRRRVLRALAGLPVVAMLSSALMLLATVLAACGGRPDSDPTDHGAHIYGVHCASCHQRDGRGRPGAQPPLAGSAVAIGDPRALAAWLLFGERPEGLAPSHGAVRMPPFTWLSDRDIAAVITHIRSHFGNQATAVTEEEVAAARASRTRQ